MSSGQLELQELPPGGQTALDVADRVAAFVDRVRAGYGRMPTP